MSTYDLSIVLPVHNEEKVIEKVIKDIYREVFQKFKGKCELIVAEDGSIDDTKKILKRIEKEIPIKLITSKRRKGYIKAMKDAAGLSKGRVVFFSDSGGGHNPRDFFKLYKYIDDYDVVIGYKSPRRDAWYRIVLSKIFNLIVSLLFGHWYKDIDSGFRLMKKSCLDNAMAKTHTLNQCIAAELVLRAQKMGYKIKEVPVTHYRRDIGEIKTFVPKKLPAMLFKLFVRLIKLRIELL